MPSPVRHIRPRSSGRADYPHDPNKFVLVYDTSLEPANTTISFPVGGTSPNVTVTWGDGLFDTYTTIGFKTHTYASPGIYVVQASGTMTSLDHGSGANTTNNKLKLRRCLSFGSIGLTSLSQGFYACFNLVQCPSTLPSAVTTIQFCFGLCGAFNDSRVVNWNTANVTSLTATFSNLSAFNQPVGVWNTAAVTSLSSTFSTASAFNQPLNAWNTANVTTTNGCFNGSTNFNQPLSSWNTIKVTNMGGMFTNATAFNQDISGWNTAAVTVMTQMFNAATAFNQNIGSWNTAAVTTCNNMFNAASSFNQNISGWSTANVTDMTAMFFNASAFNQPIGSWNVANVNAMTSIVRNCPLFNQDISGWDIRKAPSLGAIVLSATTSAWSQANYDAALIAWSGLADTDLKSQAIASFASGGTGLTTATSNAHGMVVGSRVNISGTTSYNGDYQVTAIATNTFTFAATFVANETTGVMKHRRCRAVPLGVNAKYSAGAAATARGVLTGTYGWTITDGGQA